MEMLHGMSLERTLQKLGRLPIPVALQIAVQAAWALSAAHAVGVVHRDLKPGNIFLVDAGEPNFVKLLDFGISKRSETSSAPSRHLTGEFDILGTPDYMSPEQAVGRTARVDHRGDQYSLAVILFEALTGRMPFSAPDVTSLLQQVISEPPPQASSYNSLIPPRLDRVIDRALNKAPEERFDTIAHFAQALEGLLSEAERNPSNPRVAPQTIVPSPPSSEEDSTLLGDGLAYEGRRPSPPSLDLPGEPLRKVQEIPRTSWRAQNPLQAVRELIDRARQELGLDNLEVALSCAESAIEVAQEMGDSPEVSATIRQNARLFSRIFERKLGNLGAHVKVILPASQAGGLRPEQAFLLSRFEGGLTLEEALDLSPLSRELTLSHIVGLVRAGCIQLTRK
jgi:serine/threonine protein kinase